jgi:CBS domain containing-hemolysin-like protein
VGEIQDEQDLEEIPPLSRASDGSFEADGRLTLDVAQRELGLKLPAQPPEVETLGGYLLTLLAEVPVPGDIVTTAQHRFTVLEVRDRRIRRVRGEPLPDQQAESSGEPEDPR